MARDAGGESPLPEPPDVTHLTDLQALAGNEQLAAVVDRSDQLAPDFDTWTKAQQSAGQRLPAFQRLQRLLHHADDLPAAADARLQIDAIVQDRRLLEPSDPVPPLAATLVDALRTALAQAHRQYNAAFEQEWQRLTASESWQQIGQPDRDAILQRLHIATQSKPATGTEQEVLASVDRIPLESWRTRTLALTQLFSHARAAAGKLVEPKIRPATLRSATLRTPADVAAWIEATNHDLLDQVQQGPLAIG